MSNFDFGAGPTQDYRPPAPHLLPQQPPGHVGNLPPGGGMPPGQGMPPTMPPTGMPPGALSPAEEKVRPGAGIIPVGVISCVLLLLLALGGAYFGNRVWPINSRVDSAWRSVDGSAQDFTGELRKIGYTCSDEGNNVLHFHRACAKFDDQGQAVIEFSGVKSDGQIKRLYVTGNPGDDLTTALSTGLQPNLAAAVKAKIGGGQAGQQDIPGGGSIGYDSDGTLGLITPWPGAPAEGAMVPGGVEGVRLAATAAGYACQGTDPITCRHNGDGAGWVLTASGSSNPLGASVVKLDGTVVNTDRLDPAKELERVLPPSPARSRATWFVSSANQKHGGSGFAAGLLVDYRVTNNSEGKPSKVVMTVRTPCRPDPDGQVSC